MRKPIVCLDFDGVLHSYSSGWVTASFIPDPPVPGAMAFLAALLEKAEVHIYSSRSGQEGGIDAMQTWVHYWAKKELEISIANSVHNQLKWPEAKPPALVTLDDRAITFTGTFPDVDDLLAFQPWNKA